MVCDLWWLSMLNLLSFVVAKIVNFLLGLEFLHLSTINNLTHLSVGVSMILGAFILAPIYRFLKKWIAEYFEDESLRLGWKARVASFITLIFCFSGKLWVSSLAIIVFLFVIPIVSYKMRSVDFEFGGKFAYLKDFLKRVNESRHNLSNKVEPKSTTQNQPKKSAARKYRRRY